MKKNFNELFSKVKPEAQERVNARSSQLLREMSSAEIGRATEAEDTLTPSKDVTSTPSDESAARANVNK